VGVKNLSEVFELHFQPKPKEDLIFDSFCYEPTNVYENRLGSLYISGELKNALPEDSRFLNKIVQIIKGKYYAFPITSLEKSFESSLKSANDFLAEEIKKDNTSWLGNLSLAIISLKNFDINFTKVGEIKIILLRNGIITDIGERLKFSEIEPYPIKIFGNIATGKLVEDDQVLVLTKEIYEAFSKPIEDKTSATFKKLREKNEKTDLTLINEIAQLQATDKAYEKKLRKILKVREKFLSQSYGVCLIIALKEEPLPKKTLKFEQEAPVFSIASFLESAKNKITSFFKRFKKTPALSKPAETAPSEKVTEKIKLIPKIVLGETSKKINVLAGAKFPPKLGKRAILILALIVLLGFGFLISKRESSRQIQEINANLEKIQKKLTMAENFLILKKEDQARPLLIEAWEAILPLTMENTSNSNEILTLKNNIEKDLKEIDKVESILDPKLFFEFSGNEFFPQKMVASGKEIYFFNPTSENLFRLNEKAEKTLIPLEQKFSLATATSGNILFFAKPDSIFPLEQESFTIKVPYPDYDFVDFSAFKDSIYFLDGKSGDIVKFTPKEGEKISEGNVWLDPKTKKSEGAKSFTVDSSIWILDKNNEIQRYFKGVYQDTLKLDIFPSPKNFNKILTKPGLPYIYILEPAQNRIIVISKSSATIVKQFQSDKFDDPKDFSVSDDGKTIYLLNDQKVYQIQLQ
jgi:hypothetical protein